MEMTLQTENNAVFSDYPDVVSVDDLCRMLHISTATDTSCLRISR